MSEKFSSETKKPKKDYLISSMNFCYFIFIFPWKWHGSAFEQTWIPLLQKWFVSTLVEIGQYFEKDFKMSCIFWNCYNFSLWEKSWPFIYTNMNPLRIVLSYLFEIGQLVLEKIFKFYQCIFYISLLSHRYKAEILLKRHKTVINQSTLGKGCGPLFEKNFNSLSLNNALCQVWLKLV